MPDPARVATVDDLVAYTLTFPGAWEDFPWGERVAKVGKKVFVFLGMGVDADGGFGIGVKLPTSAAQALELPWCKPSGYGLGKAGWVSVSIAGDAEIPVDVLRRWIAESYRAVAPKKLVKSLDARSTP